MFFSVFSQMYFLENNLNIYVPISVGKEKAEQIANILKNRFESEDLSVNPFHVACGNGVDSIYGNNIQTNLKREVREEGGENFGLLRRKENAHSENFSFYDEHLNVMMEELQKHTTGICGALQPLIHKTAIEVINSIAPRSEPNKMAYTNPATHLLESTSVHRDVFEIAFADYKKQNGSIQHQIETVMMGDFNTHEYEMNKVLVTNTQSSNEHHNPEYRPGQQIPSWWVSHENLLPLTDSKEWKSSNDDVPIGEEGVTQDDRTDNENGYLLVTRNETITESKTDIPDHHLNSGVQPDDPHAHGSKILKTDTIREKHLKTLQESNKWGTSEQCDNGNLDEGAYVLYSSPGTAFHQTGSHQTGTHRSTLLGEQWYYPTKPGNTKWDDMGTDDDPPKSLQNVIKTTNIRRDQLNTALGDWDLEQSVATRMGIYNFKDTLTDQILFGEYNSNPSINVSGINLGQFYSAMKDWPEGLNEQGGDLPNRQYSAPYNSGGGTIDPRYNLATIFQLKYDDETQPTDQAFDIFNTTYSGGRILYGKNNRIQYTDDVNMNHLKVALTDWFEDEPDFPLDTRQDDGGHVDPSNPPTGSYTVASKPYQNLNAKIPVDKTQTTAPPIQFENTDGQLTVDEMCLEGNYIYIKGIRHSNTSVTKIKLYFRDYGADDWNDAESDVYYSGFELPGDPANQDYLTNINVIAVPAGHTFEFSLGGYQDDTTVMFGLVGAAILTTITVETLQNPVSSTTTLQTGVELTVSEIVAEESSINRVHIDGEVFTFVKTEQNMNALSAEQLEKWQRMEDPYHGSAYETLSIVLSNPVDTNSTQTKIFTTSNANSARHELAIRLFANAIGYSGDFEDVATPADAALTNSRTITYPTFGGGSIFREYINIEVAGVMRPLEGVFLLNPVIEKTDIPAGGVWDKEWKPESWWSYSESTIQNADGITIRDTATLAQNATPYLSVNTVQNYHFEESFDAGQTWTDKWRTPHQSIPPHEYCAQDGNHWLRRGGTVIYKYWKIIRWYKNGNPHVYNSNHQLIPNPSYNLYVPTSHQGADKFTIRFINVSTNEYTFTYKNNTSVPISILYKQPVNRGDPGYQSPNQLADAQKQLYEKNIGYNLKHRLRHILNVDHSMDLKKTAENQKSYTNPIKWKEFVESTDKNSNFVIGEGGVFPALYFASLDKNISSPISHSDLVALPNLDAYSQYTRVRSKGDWFDLDPDWRQYVANGEIRIKEKKFETYTSNTVLYGHEDQVKASGMVGIHQLETALTDWPSNAGTGTDTNKLYDILLRHNALDGSPPGDLNDTTSGLMLFGGQDKIHKTNVTKAQLEHAFSAYAFTATNHTLHSRFVGIDGTSAANHITVATNGVLSTTEVTKAQLEQAFSDYAYTSSDHSLKERFENIDNSDQKVTYSHNGCFRDTNVSKSLFERAFGNSYGSTYTSTDWSIKKVIDEIGNNSTSISTLESKTNLSTSRGNETTHRQVVFWDGVKFTTGTDSSDSTQGWDSNDGVTYNMLLNSGITEATPDFDTFQDRCKVLPNDNLVTQVFTNRTTFELFVRMNLMKEMAKGYHSYDDTWKSNILRGGDAKNDSWHLRNMIDTAGGFGHTTWPGANFLSIYGEMKPVLEVTLNNATEIWVVSWGRTAAHVPDGLMITSTNDADPPSAQEAPAEILPFESYTGSERLLVKRIKRTKRSDGTWNSGNITIDISDKVSSYKTVENSFRSYVPSDMLSHINTQSMKPMAWVFDRLRKLSVMTKLHFLSTMSGLTPGYDFNNWRDKMLDMVYHKSGAVGNNGKRDFRFDGPSEALKGHYYTWMIGPYPQTSPEDGDDPKRKTFDDMFDYDGTHGPYNIPIKELQQILKDDWY